METQWCPLQSTHCIMYVVILYENLYSFLCPQENKKLALPKNSALEPDHFQKLATLVPRKAVNIWKEGKEGKKSPFTKIILSEYVWTGFSWTKQQFQVILITVSKIKAR